MTKQTIYNATHRAHGAKMVDFGGWDMPIHYGSQIEEHHQVRRDAGMFDVVIVHRLDRFARNLMTTLETLQRIERSGCGFVSISESMDFSSAIGKVILATLAAFAQFASDLDKATRDQLTRGEKLSEVIKQPQYQPLPVEKQVAIIFAATNGYLDEVPVDQVRKFEDDLFRFLESRHPGILSGIAEKKVIDDEAKKGLEDALKEFNKEFAAAPAAV